MALRDPTFLDMAHCTWKKPPLKAVCIRVPLVSITWRQSRERYAGVRTEPSRQGSRAAAGEKSSWFWFSCLRRLPSTLSVHASQHTPARLRPWAEDVHASHRHMGICVDAALLAQAPELPVLVERCSPGWSEATA